MASRVVACTFLALWLISSCRGRSLPTYYGSPFFSSDEDDIPPTTASLDDVQESLASVQGIVTTMQANISTMAEILGQIGAIYTRWGRGSCDSGSSLLYIGFMAGAWYQHTGGGADYLCLPDVPEYDLYIPGYQGEATLHTTELMSANGPPPFDTANQCTPRCSVCRTIGRSSVVMIPARVSCPNGMTKDYQGYLMASDHVEYRTQHICVDKGVECKNGTEANKEGAHLHFTEASSNSEIPQDVYTQEKELTCVVCSV